MNDIIIDDDFKKEVELLSKKSKTAKWTKQIEGYLLYAYNQGLIFKDIAKAVNKKFNTHFSEDAVCSKYRRIIQGI